MIDGCSKEGKAATKHGRLCYMHRMRIARYGDPNFVKAVRKQHCPDICTYEGCERPYLCKGFCGLHYGRLKRLGDPSPDALKIRPFGTGTILKGGYIDIKKGKTRKLLHRMLTENHLGRTLSKGEVVHHIDCDPTNNEITNLEVMPRGQHSKLHSVLAALLSIDEQGFRHLNNHLNRHGLKLILQKALFPTF